MSIIEEIIKLFGKPISGYSVTSRVKSVDQPYGGYISSKMFEKITLQKEVKTLYEEENINPGLVGMAVDYLTRYKLSGNAKNAFRISLEGAKIIHKTDVANELLKGITTELDSKSIINAVKLTGFDVCYRIGPYDYKPIEEIEPDLKTISNIQTMVLRSLVFFEEYGPIVLEGFTFEGGYTNTVSKGDGDFITADTLWDFKVSKEKTINKKQSLQLLMYYRMGLHSIHEEFQNIKYLGIFNPRQNLVSRLDVSKIPEDVIQKVERDIIGY